MSPSSTCPPRTLEPWISWWLVPASWLSPATWSCWRLPRHLLTCSTAMAPAVTLSPRRCTATRAGLTGLRHREHDTTGRLIRSALTVEGCAGRLVGMASCHAVVRAVRVPVTTYYLLLSATAMLVVIGLVMVLSASSVTSYRDTNSSYTVFLSQLQSAVVGVICAFVATRVRLITWKRISVPLLALAIFLQALVFVPGLGVSINGNRNWIQIAGQQVQPSEFAKVALVLFGATVLTKKRRKLGEFMHAAVPLVFPAGALLLLLVLGGKDLGTGLVLLAILGGLLFAAGVPARMFLVAGAAFAALAAVMVVTSANRMGRINDWIGGGCVDPHGSCWQTTHGQYALADGGWRGVGLGASREKWLWLPAAHNL